MGRQLEMLSGSGIIVLYYMILLNYYELQYYSRWELPHVLLYFYYCIHKNWRRSVWDVSMFEGMAQIMVVFVSRGLKEGYWNNQPTNSDGI